jgi:hypothetical protein
MAKNPPDALMVDATGLAAQADAFLAQNPELARRAEAAMAAARARDAEAAAKAPVKPVTEAPPHAVSVSGGMAPMLGAGYSDAKIGELKRRGDDLRHRGTVQAAGEPWVRTEDEARFRTASRNQPTGTPNTVYVRVGYSGEFVYYAKRRGNKWTPMRAHPTDTSGYKQLTGAPVWWATAVYTMWEDLLGRMDEAVRARVTPAAAATFLNLPEPPPEAPPEPFDPTNVTPD